MTTLERQKKNIKKIILDYSILSLMILAIAVVTFVIIINYGLTIDMYVFAVVIFVGLFLYCFIPVVRYFGIALMYKNVSEQSLETKIVHKCKQVVFIIGQRGRTYSDIAYIKFIDENGQKFYFVLPWAFVNYKSRRLEIKQKYINKTFKIECYGGSNAVKMLKGFEKPLYY